MVSIVSIFNVNESDAFQAAFKHYLFQYRIVYRMFIVLPVEVVHLFQNHRHYNSVYRADDVPL